MELMDEGRTESDSPPSSPPPPPGQAAGAGPVGGGDRLNPGHAQPVPPPLRQRQQNVISSIARRTTSIVPGKL